MIRYQLVLFLLASMVAPASADEWAERMKAGIAAQKQGDLKASAKAFRDALQVVGSERKDSTKRRVATLGRLADALEGLSDTKRAAAALGQIREILVKNLGADHPRVKVVEKRLAKLGSSSSTTPITSPSPAPPAPASRPAVDPKITYEKVLALRKEGKEEDAFELLVEAGEAGHGEALSELVEIYGDEEDPRYDPDQAMVYYKVAVAKPDLSGRAEYRLGLTLIRTVNDLENNRRAERHFQTALDRGEPKAHCAMGVMHMTGGPGFPEDLKKAKAYFQVGADAGDPDAMYNLGISEEEGWSGSADPIRALEWYRKASDLGNPKAMAALGSLIFETKGLDHEIDTARVWLEQSVAHGNSHGQLYLGHLYLEGRGVEKDREEAIRLYRLAASQGYAPASQQLRNMGLDPGSN